MRFFCVIECIDNFIDRTDVGKSEMEVERARAAARWETYSTREKLAEITSRHPYSLIGGSWAASMIGAYAWISRDPLATPLQKVSNKREEKYKEPKV